MNKFAQFALVLQGLAAFAAGIYFLEDGRAGVGVVLLLVGMFCSVAVLANAAPMQPDEDLDLRPPMCPRCLYAPHPVGEDCPHEELEADRQG